MYVLRFENIVEYPANIGIHIFPKYLWYKRIGTEIKKYLLPYGSLGPTGNDPYGSQTLGMGPIIDVFIHCKLRKKMCPQGAGNL